MYWGTLAQYIKNHEHRPGPWMDFFYKCDSSADFSEKLSTAIQNSSPSDVQITLSLFRKLVLELKESMALAAYAGATTNDPRFREISTAIEFSEALIDFFERC